MRDNKNESAQCFVSSNPLGNFLRVMLRSKAMLLIFLDTETTGLNPEKHRALEIAFQVIEAGTGRSLVSHQSIIAQTAEVWAEADPESLKVNGFTWEMLLKGKTEHAVAAEITGDLNHAGLGEKGGVFICQNPSFDRAFFSQLIDVDQQDAFEWPYHWLDLASMFWALRLREDPKNLTHMSERDLTKNKIAAAYGLPPETGPHRAMNGVEHLIACYQALFNRAPAP